MPGAPDPEILARAGSEGRTLLPFDKDFGELAFRSGLAAPCGTILFRLGPRSPGDAASAVLTAMRAREDWSGHFPVVEPGSVRLVPLPPAQSCIPSYGQRPFVEAPLRFLVTLGLRPPLLVGPCFEARILSRLGQADRGLGGRGSLCTFVDHM